MASSQLGAFAAFFASVTWAYASARYAKATQRVGAVRVNLVRALSATALWMTVLVVVQGSAGFSSLSSQHAWLLAGSIMCSYGAGDTFFFAAANRIGVSAALSVATLYPLWAALYGAWFHDEPFGLRRVLGLACCLGGVSWLVSLSRNATDLHTAANERSLVRWGFGLALITSFFWAGNTVLLKQGSVGLSVYQSNALRFTFGALILTAQLPFLRKAPNAEHVPFTTLLRWLVLPLVIDTGIGSVCFVYGLAHTDLALGATLSSLSPLAALPVAAAMGTERVTLRKVLAVTLTVAGIALLVTTPT